MSAGPSPGADAHTRIVGLAKIALPLGGLALLSSLFLLAGEDDRPSAPLTPEVRGIAREQRLSAPVHAGVTEAGDAVEISARVARPDPRDPRLLEAEAIRARIVSPEGERIDLGAPEGRIDTVAGVVTLSGGIGIEGSGGLAAEAEAVTVQLDTGRVEATGPVTGRAPFGALEAGALMARGDHIRLDGGVRLTYRPPSPAD